MSEGPSWRPADFRRFLIGRLADGREEWMEFWRGNQLHKQAAMADDRADKIRAIS